MSVVSLRSVYFGLMRTAARRAWIMRGSARREALLDAIDWMRLAIDTPKSVMVPSDVALTSWGLGPEVRA